MEKQDITDSQTEYSQADKSEVEPRKSMETIDKIIKSMINGYTRMDLLSTSAAIKQAIGE